MIRMTNDGYYVYIHKSIKDKCPIYVGKGCGLRAFDRESRNEQHKVGMAEAYYIDVVQSGLDEQAALDLEDTLIRAIGRKDLGLGPLLNQSGGVEEKSIEHDEVYGMIMNQIDVNEKELTPFTYTKLGSQLGINNIYELITTFDLKGTIAQTNERIDKQLIRLAIENGCYTNGEIARHTGIELNDRFIKRINEVKQENGS